MRGRAFTCFILLSCVQARADVPIEEQFQLPMPRTGMPLTMRQDATGRDALYVAAKEAGVRVQDTRGTPAPLCTVPAAAFGGLHAMSLTQDGDRLYVALGNHWGRSQGAGLAVLDVREPRATKLLGLWKEAGGGGGGAVAVRGGVAYLAAMGSGVYVLDVADAGAIRERAHIVPDPAFPDRRPDRKKVNARGLALDGDRLYVCYDAGGLRVLDVADPGHPREIGRYANPAMNGKPRAYNDVVVRGAHAFVTVDYVGVEALDVSGPQPRLVSWWNPWNPTLNGWKWFGCAGHANEIALDSARARLYVAAGKTDLVVLDASDPAHLRPLGTYGDVDDARATWGVSCHGDRVYLAYICTLGIPFRADWAGVRALRVR